MLPFDVPSRVSLWGPREDSVKDDIVVLDLCFLLQEQFALML
jgi:hypothetical protein